VSENATCIVSGDADLLALDPFRGIPIMRPADFLEWIEQNE
jgi:predicted nucleic acid-binding protein